MPTTAIARSGAEWSHLLDAAYQTSSDEQSWARELVAAMRQLFRCGDDIGLRVIDPGPQHDVGPVLVDLGRTPTKHDCSLLSRIGLHLESAHRLRRRPEAVKAVLTVTAPPGHRSAVASPEAALRLWSDLASGRRTLVPRTEDGVRCYLVLENDPRSHDVRALSKRELDVLSMAARGLSSKVVAYDLGLSPAAVSSALSRAASKLGLATRPELLRLAATLAHDLADHALPITVTVAEAEVVALLRQGLSNREIARIRSRSVRTVANQVASLLRKTASGSRRAFVADASSAAVLTDK